MSSKKSFFVLCCWNSFSFSSFCSGGRLAQLGWSSSSCFNFDMAPSASSSITVESLMRQLRKRRNTGGLVALSWLTASSASWSNLWQHNERTSLIQFHQKFWRKSKKKLKKNWSNSTKNFGENSKNPQEKLKKNWFDVWNWLEFSYRARWLPMVKRYSMRAYSGLRYENASPYRM